MARTIFIVTTIIAMLLLTITVPTIATQYPDWNDLPGNLLVNPSFEAGPDGWMQYDVGPTIISDIVYHGNKAAYFEHIHSGHTALTYQFLRPPVYDFITIFHIYCFSDERNWQLHDVFDDIIGLRTWEAGIFVFVVIDYYYDKLIFQTNHGSYSLDLPLDRWVTVMIVKTGNQARFYLDGEYITTLTAAEGPFDEFVVFHRGYHGYWVLDAVYVGRISNLTVYSHGGSGNHYEDTTNNVLKAETFALPDSISTAETFIRYKFTIDTANNYTFYIPMEYRLSYGIEYGGFVYAKLNIRIWNANTYADQDWFTRYLVYKLGQYSGTWTVEGDVVYKKVLELEPGEYYLEITVTLYVESWDGEAWIDMYGTNYYLDAWIPGYEP